ncbi:hypothetical protein [Paenibacillus ehimensis]|nr:hypothetical protein [Paenibacillus ehimensis]
MLQKEVLICGECKHWVDGKCLLTGTNGVEPEEMGFGELACEEFEEATK